MAFRRVVTIKTLFTALLIVSCLALLTSYVTRHQRINRSAYLDDENLPTAPMASDEDVELDQSTEIHDDHETDFTLKDYPNFPAVFFEKDAKKPKSPNKTCASFPSLEKIRFNNLYWQTLKTPAGEYHLLGAYWDVRPLNKNSPTVRLLSMATPWKITEDLYCQFWFENEVILSQKIWSYLLWREGWGGNSEQNFKPYLINCKLPEKYIDKRPIAVSLVKKACDQASNILKITVDIPAKKKDFAVCVKGLDFHDDISYKLIEWIELLRLLGAHKIFFYELHVNDKVRKILHYYEGEDAVEMTPVTLPGHYPNEPYLQHLFLSQYRTKKRLYELISYNDCFWKHMYEYKYIVLLDIDEVIVPSRGNWSTLLADITSDPAKAGKSSYNARMAYFFDDYISEADYFPDIPDYMHILQHVYRVKEVMKPGMYIKSFHNTDLVLALHNHFPLYCVDPCKNLSIDPDKAKLHHYRKTCVGEVKNCSKLKEDKVKDLTLWTYKDKMIGKVTDVVKKLDVRR